MKNPNAEKHGQIYFHDIGDYLSQQEKLEIVNDFGSVEGISKADGWQSINPDEHGDWLKQRDDSFEEFISLGDKKDKSSLFVFENYSRGIATSRDAWCYNSSRPSLSRNIKLMIDFYNEEVNRYELLSADLDLDSVINTDSTKISWNRGLKNDLSRLIKHSYQEEALAVGLYRPFTKSHVYFSKHMNDMVYQMPKIFPNYCSKNVVICMTGRGSTKGFCAFVSNVLPDLEMVSKGQCFPLYLYEKTTNDDLIDFDGLPKITDMFATQSSQKTKVGDSKYQRKDGINDAGLAHFTAAYPNEKISKEDVFYYVYGLLHSSDYRERYADNLSKELPRIPCVKTAGDFWHFSQAGRDLAELHLNYETVECYPVTLDTGKKKLAELDDKDFYVTKMKFAKKGEKHTVIYNHQITIHDIPEAAFDYVVNGKAALAWVMERQAVTTHKASGIVNDANDWAIETIGNAKYPLELLQRVITVSLETMKIVNNLPALDID